VIDRTSGHFYGFVDLIDVVTTILSIIDYQGSSQTNEDFYSLLDQVEQFDQTGVEQVTDLSRRNPFCPMLKSTTVAAALGMIKQTGAHRLPILEGQSLVGILTEVDIISHIKDNISLLGDWGRKSISEIALGMKQVITVYDDTIAIDAFRLMIERKITGLPILNRETGSVVSNLNARDIKLIAGEVLFTKLFKSVKEFLQDVELSNTQHTTPNETSINVLTVNKETKMKEVVEGLVTKNMHQVYIVDNEQKPIGVITLGDVLHSVCHFEQSSNK